MRLANFFVFITLVMQVRGFLKLASRSRTMSTFSIPKKLSKLGPILDSADIFVFDCDGVIWKGDTLIHPKVSEVLEELKRNGKKVFFVTNNSTKSRKGYLKKFLELGLKVSSEEILSSSFAAALYFQRNPLPPGKKSYIIGQQGICEELQLIGVPYIGAEADNNKVIKLGPGVKIEQDPDVAAVIVGFDSGINYYKIQYAQLCLNENSDCKFIATNLDAVTHLTAEQEWAGNGAMVGAIKGCTGKEPIIVGKPSSLLVDHILEKFKVEKSRVCMVGDRLDTDILFGIDNGLQTILTLSGVTSFEDVQDPKNKVHPDYIIDSVADFF